MVRYANNKIFAVAPQNGKLRILNPELETVVLVDHESGDHIRGALGIGVRAFAVSNDYVAIVEYIPDVDFTNIYFRCAPVTVFSHNGNVVLVSYL